MRLFELRRDESPGEDAASSAENLELPLRAGEPPGDGPPPPPPADAELVAPPLALRRIARENWSAVNTARAVTVPSTRSEAVEAVEGDIAHFSFCVLHDALLFRVLAYRVQ